MELSVILATTTDDIIGIGTECVHSAIDKEHFKIVTQYTNTCGSNLLIIGRKTWETIPISMIKCPHRKYLVITKQPNYKKLYNETIVNSFNDALQYCTINKNNFYKIFVVGGAEIYKMATDTGFVTEIFLTKFSIEVEKEIPLTKNIVKYQPPIKGFCKKF